MRNVGSCLNKLLPFLITHPIEVALDLSLTVSGQSCLTKFLLWKICYQQRRHQALKGRFLGVLHPSQGSWKIGLGKAVFLGIADNPAELWLRLQLRGAGGM